MKKILKKLGKIIRQLREEKKISQEVLAEALEIPRPSLSQLENGQRDLSFLEFSKILEIFHLSYEQFNNYLLRSKKITRTKKCDVSFSEDKFKQLLLYILEKCGAKPNVGETVLYKLLYFCDFDYFEIHEKPLTGMPYIRLQFGPVPVQANYNPIIRKMVEAKELTLIRRVYTGETVQTKYIPLISYNINNFLPQEIEVMNKAINRLSDMSARQIEDHVHRDYPWLSHQDGEIIEYGSVFGRDGEFAQRDYEQMWQTASAKDILGELGTMSKKEHEYYVNL